MEHFKLLKSWVTFLILIFCATLNAQEIYIAENGNDDNVGSIDEPLLTIIAARNKSRSTGIKTILIRGGRYNFDTTCDLDSQDSGMTISGYQDEKVIFDGSKYIEVENFKIVSNSNLLTKLNDKAKGKVYSQTIVDSTLIELLKNPRANISINDQMVTVARYPNIGYAHVDNATVSEEEKNKKGTLDDPKGPLFKTKETISSFLWQAELNRTKKARARGYISADWLKEDFPLHSVGSGGQIKLVNGSRYGVQGGNHPNRLFFYNLLCELDEPGEWYYDDTDAQLYLWPTTTIDKNMTIGTWAGPQCFQIKDARDVTIKKIIIQNLGKGNNGQGAINITGKSENILVAGVTFRYISEPLTSVNIWREVKDSHVISCDFYDVSNNSRLYGGKLTPTSVEYGGNSIENCHFTQVYSKDFYGKACGITGAGNTFKNNLIHNMNGQPVTHAGVDHVIELNEAFNVGIEEGDGGAFYTGNAVWSFGNVIRHNFVHHLMRVPKLLGRAAFFSDDLDAGEEVYENVIYKGGWQAIKMNRGGGHSILRNVVLESSEGIKNSDSNEKGYTRVSNWLINDPTSNNKDNYFGRMLKTIGVPDWQTDLTVDNWTDKISDFWIDRYPKMGVLLNTYNDNNIIKAYECRFYDNMFYGNKVDITGGPTVMVSGSQTITLDLFVNPENLNFKFKESRPDFAPDIPFEKIGLYLDEYRCAVPNKESYRRKIKQRFDGQKSHDRDPYDYTTINKRLYYNTGKIIYRTMPCAGVVEEMGEDSFLVKVTGETCVDKENGMIKITSKVPGNYKASFNDSEINFNKEWTIENIVPGNYDLCITEIDESLTQCYNLQIEEGTTVAAEASFVASKVYIDVTQGTAPFDVTINGEMVLQTSSPSFSIHADQEDIIEVKTGVPCEGVFSKRMSDISIASPGVVVASPNPTDGYIGIVMPTKLKTVTIDLYDSYSRLTSSKEYGVVNGKVELNMNDVPAGFYVAIVQFDKPTALKILKK